MILTLTPNPSVDRTCAIEHLERGAVIRALDSREDPGGKGLNVSRALALSGTATAAVFPVGGVYGTLMLELLAAEPIELRPVRIGRPIRANTTVVEPDGTRDSHLQVGAPYFREAGVEHDVVNANDHDFTFVEIELRQ